MYVDTITSSRLDTLLVPYITLIPRPQLDAIGFMINIFCCIAGMAFTDSRALYSIGKTHDSGAMLNCVGYFDLMCLMFVQRRSFLPRFTEFGK